MQLTALIKAFSIFMHSFAGNGGLGKSGGTQPFTNLFFEDPKICDNIACKNRAAGLSMQAVSNLPCLIILPNSVLPHGVLFLTHGI